MKLPELINILAGPAVKALADINIKSINDFRRYTHTEIEELHGIGKKAMLVIDAELEKHNVEYKNESDNSEVTDYINGFEKTIKQALLEIRNIIRKAIPKAQEKMAYGMPTYYYRENLIHFAGFKNHIGIYPTPQVIEEFKEEIEKYKTSKGAMQIPVNEKIPAKLIKEIAEYRYKEMMNKRSGTVS